MLCNPSSPVGAPGYFTNTIVGMASYCTGFAKVPATVAGIASYVNSHNLPGVVATERLDADLPPAQLDAGLPVHPDHGLLLGPPGRVHEVRSGQRHLPPAHDLGRPVPDHLLLGGQVVHPGAQPGLVGRVRPAPARLRQQDQHHRGADRRTTSSSSSSRAPATWNGTSPRPRRTCPRWCRQEPQPGHRPDRGRLGVHRAGHLPDPQPVRRAAEEQAGPPGRRLRGEQERHRADPRRQGGRLDHLAADPARQRGLHVQLQPLPGQQRQRATRPRPRRCWPRPTRPASR